MTVDRSSYDQRWHNAVRFAEQVVRTAKDWEDAQHALADHPVHGPYIEGIARDDIDRCAVVQQIIREAEGNLGDHVPY